MSVKYPIPGEFFDEHDVVDLGKEGVWDMVFTDSPWHDRMLQSGLLEYVSPGKFSYRGMKLEFKWMPINEFIKIQACLVAENKYEEHLPGYAQGVIDEFVVSADLDYVRRIQEKMKSGTPYVAFILHYFIGGSIIPFQEGRHRAIAAWWNGIKKVPVWIFNLPEESEE
jgi:hypothetical protein